MKVIHQTAKVIKYESTSIGSFQCVWPRAFHRKHTLDVHVCEVSTKRTLSSNEDMNRLEELTTNKPVPKPIEESTSGTVIWQVVKDPKCRTVLLSCRKKICSYTALLNQ